MLDRLHFYDPLYDYVTFEEAEKGIGDGLEFFEKFGFGNSIRSKGEAKRILPFLNTFELNRLNFLRQSGLAFLVYPSSTHTRFAHAIGCCYLGFMACEKIMVKIESHTEKKSEEKNSKLFYLSKWLDDKNLREEFLLALLLHDLGHFPFSHALESNLEFWKHFPNHFTHEDLACELIKGEMEDSLKLNDKSASQRFKMYVKSKFDFQKVRDVRYTYVSELINEDKHKDIDVNVLCYLISGNVQYLKKIDKPSPIDINLAHDLVSGLLDLDRIDHYRRDSYFSGLKFGSNLNFPSLLGGITMLWRIDKSKQNLRPFELCLSTDAIGHALTLLHSKDRLVHNCFENPFNLSYEAMLQRAVNLFLDIDHLGEDMLSGTVLDNACELLFLTDDELLERLIQSDNNKVKEFIFRIKNRNPYHFVAKKTIDPYKHPIKSLREELIKDTGLGEDDIITRVGKHYGSEKVVPDEWMALRRLSDHKGNRLDQHNDYRELMKYFESIQEQNQNVVWIFTRNSKNTDKILGGLAKYDKEL